MKEPDQLPTLYWENNCLYILDQRLLPHHIKYQACSSYREVVGAISNLAVRGAPAIGIAAAFGMAVAAREALAKKYETSQMRTYLEEASEKLLQSRPTAVNLFWALNRIDRWLSASENLSSQQIADGLVSEADKILKEDLDNNRKIGINGSVLVPDRASVLTHCNAGALATGGYGTALGIVRAAAAEGKDVHVFIGETRPLLQGARLTAFEMIQEQIPATLITDSCAGYLMKQGKIDLIIVGADRIAGNGDTANKIGTYSLAVMADYHNIPFYVAAPLSTIDPALVSGKDIIIEERKKEEVTHLGNCHLAPAGINVYNPAFDVTPSGLIRAIITEKGITDRPNREKLYKLFTNV